MENITEGPKLLAKDYVPFCMPSLASILADDKFTINKISD
jgi:hypothetical protein